jgi:putative transposase
MLAARGICVTYETVRQWGKKFGETFSDQIRQRAPARGDKWHMDEVVVSIAGEQHWLWRAVDQNGFVLDVLVQRRRDTGAAQRLMRKLLKSAVKPPRVMITDKLRSYGAARSKMGLRAEHRQHKGLKNRARILISRRPGTLDRTCWARHVQLAGRERRSIKRLHAKASEFEGYTGSDGFASLSPRSATIERSRQAVRSPRASIGSWARA